MTKRVLNVLTSAYRATLEEQDDPAIWLARSLGKTGLSVHVLLEGSAVSYITKNQKPPPLVIGAWTQKNPPDIGEDLAQIAAAGGKVYFVEEDAKARGIDQAEWSGYATPVSRGALVELFTGHDFVWRW